MCLFKQSCFPLVPYVHEESSDITFSFKQLSTDSSLPPKPNLTAVHSISGPALVPTAWQLARELKDKLEREVAVQLTFKGGFVSHIQFQPRHFTLPEIGDWKFADSLPEIRPGFSDALWTIASHTTTNCPRKPYYGDGRVLYGCDYG